MSVCKAPYGLNCSTAAVPSGILDTTIGWACTVGDASTCQDVANDDISGIGTIVAFLATALITFLLAWILYLCDHDTTYNNIKDPQSPQSSHTNILDHRFRSFLIFTIARRKTAPRLSDRWHHILQRSMVALSDGHLITGFAIMVAAFSQAKSITIYHFAISTYLAWLSFSVHMVTLTVCRPLFAARRALIYWRLGAAGVLCVLMLTGLGLTGSPQAPQNNVALQNTYDSDVWEWKYGQQSISEPIKPPSPFFMDTAIICAWSCGEMGPWPADTIIAVTLISLGYLARCIRIIPHAASFWRRRVITPSGALLASTFLRIAERRKASPGPLKRTVYSALLFATCTIYLNCRVLVDIFGSLFSELYWLSLLLFWGASKLVVWRIVSPTSQYENNWGFGQVLPLFLLLAPFAAIPELYISYGQLTKGGGAITSHTLATNTSRPSCYKPVSLQSSSTQVLPFHQTTIPPLFADRNIAYTSKLYRFQIICYLSAGITWGFLVIGYAVLDSNGGVPANSLQVIMGEPVYISMYVLPTICGPMLLCTLLAPFSRFPWRAVRGISFGSTGRP